MIYTEGSRVVVNEVYIGRTPEIQKFFNDFSNIRKKYLGTLKTPTDKEYKVIERHMENIFGFSIVHFEIQKSMNVNAYTYAVSSGMFSNADDMIHTTKNGGYKYDKKAKVAVMTYMTRGMFNNEDFTDEEAFACLLHEIGHSFVVRGNNMKTISALYTYIKFMDIIMNTLKNLINNSDDIDAIKQVGGTIVGLTLSGTNVGKRFSASVNNLLRKNNVVHNIYKFSREIENAINIILNSWNYVLGMKRRIITAIPYRIFASFMDNIWSVIGGNPFRSIEYLSDDFAVIYGFGAGMDSALRKLDSWEFNNKYNIKTKMPKPIQEINKFIDDSVKELNYAIDIHPKSEKRIYQVRKTLIRELDENKDLDPRIRAQIKEQILEICEQAEDIQNCNEYIVKNKDQAVIIIRQILKDTGENLDAGDIERQLLDRDVMDKDFISRMIDEN